MKKQWNTNGSVTVEMCVIAPVFLTVMLLLLAVLKWGVAVITVDNFTCEISSAISKYEYVYEIAQKSNDSKVFDIVKVLDVGDIKEYIINEFKKKELKGYIDLVIFDTPMQYDISDRKKYSEYGIKYDSENVTLVLKYNYKIVLPLFESTVTTTHVSVERCWNKGEYISSERTVYITNTGEKYHLLSCRYLGKSVIEITRENAIKKGYTPCSVCIPDK